MNGKQWQGNNYCKAWTRSSYSKELKTAGKKNADNCWEAFVKHADSPPYPSMKKGCEAIWFSLVCTVWLTRNGKLFNKEEADTARMFDLIQTRAFLWVGNRGKGKNCLFSDWIINPNLCRF
ncbi:hypothetical protein SLEP1_g44044 [Rubroshorea leprosula]|uniref:Uncharacterized protein n=1 Tax=Rubroshorea leprosula TaxID=152421 RepID=A0AAV5LFE0_9ROSI|nr:hypothetical protein SLEP1_g44044 [Rubroshorea leprosula]